MRSFIGLVVVTLTVGCATEATEALETSEADQAVAYRCPDPSDCTLNNGGGVYTEEVGFAGFGSTKFMITTFINLNDGNGNPTGVYVVGRGFNSATGTWQIRTTTLDHALLNNDATHPYKVLSVSEWLTTPTFVLSDSSPTNTVVTDDQLQTLQLVMLDLKIPWTLSFGAKQSDSGTTGAIVFSYPMFWNKGSTAGAGTMYDYCFRALLQNQVTPDPDPVVFQQGINVNPITAQLGRNNTDVTLSCTRGAVATARLWGYTYRGDAASSLLFEAAMHAKRASYCGDETFYTRRKTDIIVSDNAVPTPIQHSDVNSTNVEARWGRGPGGRIRALCVNYADPQGDPELRRHPHALYPPLIGVEFLSACFDANNNVEFTIPTCESFDAGGGSGVVLSDAKAP